MIDSVTSCAYSLSITNGSTSDGTASLAITRIDYWKGYHQIDSQSVVSATSWWFTKRKVFKSSALKVGVMRDMCLYFSRLFGECDDYEIKCLWGVVSQVLWWFDPAFLDAACIILRCWWSTAVGSRLYNTRYSLPAIIQLYSTVASCYCCSVVVVGGRWWRPPSTPHFLTAADTGYTTVWF